MRISKKQNNITKQNSTLANIQQLNTNSYEEFYISKLGPDFFDTRQWTESLFNKE